MKIRSVLFLGCVLLLLTSCSWKDVFLGVKEDTVERIKVFLNQIPLLGRYVTLPPPPKEFYEDLKKKIDLLGSYKIPEPYKKEYEEILSKWKEIEESYKKRYYRKCERKLKELKPKVETLLKKLEAYQEKLKKEAQEKYKLIEERAKKVLSNKTGEERLRIELYLWKLRTLISAGEYEFFFKELENVPF